MTDRQAMDNNTSKAAVAENGAGNGSGSGSNSSTGMFKSDGAATQGQTQRSPKKRRKVNHACVYCRRSHMTCDLERPCTRCIKRNIGHLCHDEPRDADAKKAKAAAAAQQQQQQQQQQRQSIDDRNEAQSSNDVTRSSVSSSMAPPQSRPRASSGFGTAMLTQRSTALPALVQPGTMQGQVNNGLGHNRGTGNANQFAGFSDAWMTAQSFHGMNNYPSNYMITPEVTHEFNLLNDFLHTSLLDDTSIATDDNTQQNRLFDDRAMSGDILTNFTAPAGTGVNNNADGMGSMLPPPNVELTAGSSRLGGAIMADKDKTREYYLQAADPSGNDNPEQRMARVLKAKYDAGLLKPFNYINGYARLSQYLDGHIATSSKQKILRTISQFRPKFREKAQGLTDMQLVYVEMWFEKQLMEYDRVFASMAVPACCWRRTGEIFRGNKEMAELINVPVDQLRDGKIALHEIMTEDAMVRYWEEFGTIAFDPAHETLLTATTLKNPSDTSNHPVVKCCFSFMIRRDDHKLPALIVGNFLPHDPPPSLS